METKGRRPHADSRFAQLTNENPGQLRVLVPPEEPWLEQARLDVAFEYQVGVLRPHAEGHVRWRQDDCRPFNHTGAIQERLQRARRLVLTYDGESRRRRQLAEKILERLPVRRSPARVVRKAEEQVPDRAVCAR